jgi:hypothetical protein
MTQQMPEAEAIEEGKTGAFYSLQDDNLASVIKAWFQSGLNRDEIRQHCYAVVDAKYNPDKQLEIFKSVLLN